MRIVNKGKIPIYQGNLKIIFANNIEEVEEKYNLEDLHQGCDAVAFRVKSNYCIAFIIGEVTPGLIAHECIHIYSYIASNHAILLSRRNDEPQSYYVQWLYNRVFESCKKEDWEKGTMKFFKHWSK